MIKILVYGMLLIGVTAFFTFRGPEPRIGPQVDEINLSAFSLYDGFSVNDSSLLSGMLTNQAGITASTINRQSKILTITYLPGQTTELAIQELVSASLGRQIQTHKYPKSDKVCPFHEGGSFAWLGRVFN
jgi:hypothetical protein